VRSSSDDQMLLSIGRSHWYYLIMPSEIDVIAQYLATAEGQFVVGALRAFTAPIAGELIKVAWKRARPAQPVQRAIDATDQAFRARAEVRQALERWVGSDDFQDALEDAAAGRTGTAATVFVSSFVDAGGFWPRSTAESSLAAEVVTTFLTELRLELVSGNDGHRAMEVHAETRHGELVAAAVRTESKLAELADQVTDDSRVREAALEAHFGESLGYLKLMQSRLAELVDMAAKEEMGQAADGERKQQTSPRDANAGGVLAPDELEGKIQSGLESSQKLISDAQDLITYHLVRDEWIVPQAREPGDYPRLRALLHRLHDDLDALKEGGDRWSRDRGVVITLYAVAFDEDLKGVDRYEYDPLYYRNLLDMAPMFGPRVQNDDRHVFEDGPEPYVIKECSPEERSGGGFVTRERIRQRASFKLLDPVSGRTAGLLYLSCRDCYIPEAHYLSDEMRHLREELAAIVVELCEIRHAAYKEGVYRVTRNDPDPPDRDSSPKAIGDFFNRFLARAKKAIGCESLRMSAFLSTGEGEAQRLEWLWASCPTSTSAVIRLAEAGSVLICEAATDANHKPLVVHKVGTGIRPTRSIQTDCGDVPRADLVLPVLDRRELTGVIDIQADDPDEFDIDEVRLLLDLVKWELPDGFTPLRNDRGMSTPVRGTQAYQPFAVRERTSSARDVVLLNFNPMKYLLRWRSLRTLIKEGRTKAPATIEVWPTMKCNHVCKWCRIEGVRSDFDGKPEMTPEELLGIARQVVALDKTDQVDVLISGGGEPLLHESIAEFAATIRDAGGALGIFTNGTRPATLSFWSSFFASEEAHRFVRISCNGHDPESYAAVHRPKERPDEAYAEMRKSVIDIMGLRSPKGSVALGDTVMYQDRSLIPDKVEHAKRLGVDFIQMRPELGQSIRNATWAAEVCEAVRQVEGGFDQPDFCVLYTDDERDFRHLAKSGHDEPRCYASQLVPTLVPDPEDGWVTVLPCSYAIDGKGPMPPVLGRMRADADFTEFWRRLNDSIAGRGAPGDASYQVGLSGFIDPKACTQCRYYRLNKRLCSLAARVEEDEEYLTLIDRLVEALSDRDESVSATLRSDIEAAWGQDVIDVDMAQHAFRLRKRLGYVPPL
jgi:MoaA/NifB/PqqE/SkfB family radical SAM enzyme